MAKTMEELSLLADEEIKQQPKHLIFEYKEIILKLYNEKITSKKIAAFLEKNVAELKGVKSSHVNEVLKAEKKAEKKEEKKAEKKAETEENEINIDPDVI